MKISIVSAFVVSMALYGVVGNALARQDDRCGPDESAIAISTTAGAVIGSYIPGVGTLVGTAAGGAIGCVIDERGPVADKYIRERGDVLGRSIDQSVHNLGKDLGKANPVKHLGL